MDLEAKKLDDMNQEDISLCDQLRDALLSWGENIYLPLIKENQRLRFQNKRLYQKNKSLSERLARLDGEIVLKESNKKQYALYNTKTDEILMVGNVQQCASYLGITTDNFKWRLTPTGRRRAKRITIIDADEIDRLEEKEKPKKEQIIKVDIAEGHEFYAKYPIDINEITLEFEEKVLIKKASFKLKKNKKVALIGENGCGKTTLINAILDKNKNIKIANIISILIKRLGDIK